MRNNRYPKGNTLALTVGFIAILLIALAFFAINYGQLTGTQKEAQTAIDAASLQAAKDMGSIVVDGPLGRIALVDDSSNNSTSIRPVMGINSVLATIRLDALIASKLGNKTIAYLVAQDLNMANAAVSQLRQRLIDSAGGNSSAYDKNGKVINIKDNAYQAYVNNSRRLGNSQASQSASALSFAVTVGTLTGADKTIIPVPTPATEDSLAYDNNNSYTDTAGKRFYKSGVSLPVPGLAQSIKLGAIAKDMRLVSSNQFSQALGTQDIPSVVQVTAVETATKLAKESSKDKKKTDTSGASQNKVRVASTAQVGGRLFFPDSGSLSVNFNGGYPTNPPAPSSGASLNFDTVVGIINASQLDPTTASPTSPYSNWNQASKGAWRVAKGGPVPGSGSLQPESYRGLTGRADDDPSVSLSFLTYDWLRSLSLRPNVKSVVSALSSNMRTMATGSQQKFTAYDGLFTQVAYAGEKERGATSAILTTSESGDDDPRNLSAWDEHSEAYQRQQARMWGYLPGDGVIASDARLVSVNNDGTVTTVDGNPLSVLDDIRDHMVKTNNHAVETYSNALEILQGIMAEREAQDPEMQKIVNNLDANPDNETYQEKFVARKAAISAQVIKEKPKVFAALVNAKYATQVIGNMKGNLKALTGGGASKVNDHHYILMGTDFYPITRTASKEQLNSGQSVATGQDYACPVKDWCEEPNSLGGEMKSKLNIYIRQAEPVIGKRYDNGWLAPAHAQATSVIPGNNQNHFIFYLTGKDNSLRVSAPGEGIVVLQNIATAPYANVPTLQGQAHYQDVNALTVAIPNDPTKKVTWQVQARSLNANAYPDTSKTSGIWPKNSVAISYPQPAKSFLDFIPAALAQNNSSEGSAAKYFKDGQATNYDKKWCGSNEECHPVAAEWAMTCPLVKADDPPPTVPPPPIPPADPEKVYKCAFKGWTIVSETLVGSNKATYELTKTNAKTGKVTNTKYNVYLQWTNLGYIGNWGTFDKLGAHKRGSGALLYTGTTNGVDTSIGSRYYVSDIYKGFEACDPSPTFFST